MDRIEKIKQFKTRQNKIKIAKKEAEMTRVTMFAKQVKELRPRISELIKTANACLEAGIEIDAYGKNWYRDLDSYEKGSFMTNSISHRLGFVKTWSSCQNNVNKRIYELGINAGGTCGCWHFRTDGVNICSVHEDDASCTKDPHENQLKDFLEHFDLFENAFYKYVDSIVEN